MSNLLSDLTLHIEHIFNIFLRAFLGVSVKINKRNLFTLISVLRIVVIILCQRFLSNLLASILF